MDSDELPGPIVRRGRSPTPEPEGTRECLNNDGEPVRMGPHMLSDVFDRAMTLHDPGWQQVPLRVRTGGRGRGRMSPRSYFRKRDGLPDDFEDDKHYPRVGMEPAERPPEEWSKPIVEAEKDKPPPEDKDDAPSDGNATD